MGQLWRKRRRPSQPCGGPTVASQSALKGRSDVASACRPLSRGTTRATAEDFAADPTSPAARGDEVRPRSGGGSFTQLRQLSVKQVTAEGLPTLFMLKKYLCRLYFFSITVDIRYYFISFR